MQKILVSLYALVNRLGLMRFALVRWLFRLLYFSYKKHLEDPFYYFVRKYPELLNGGHILDIGANIGYTSEIFARHICPPCKVYAFEPDVVNFQMLEETIQSNCLEDMVIPVFSAVGDREGNTEFLCDEGHHGNHRVHTGNYNDRQSLCGQITTVRIVSLDNFVKEEIPSSNIAFIKIDVQGYELMVCQGMQKILESNVNTVVALEYAPLEAIDMQLNPEALLTFFKDRQFIPYKMHKNGSLEEVEHETILSASFKHGNYTNILFSRREIDLRAGPKVMTTS